MTPFHFRDGVSIYLSPVDERPDDDFLTARRPTAAGEPDADEDQP